MTARIQPSIGFLDDRTFMGLRVTPRQTSVTILGQVGHAHPACSSVSSSSRTCSTTTPLAGIRNDHPPGPFLDGRAGTR